ncbi:MAG: sigma 54-interacting transcriptional regulator [Desulfomonile tiedjei]|uniref:Sigma 54-interacting transcriptional regulator n=1 Tax=Desulfomonile tiedjei TaxID=2358 RepID=A0A9D6V486_9BACT|nr:sigma 54-interacting transcriptional regulator [Desulfomonile tiedjei]
MIDHHAIGRLLLETGIITKDDYMEAIREYRQTGKSPHEILLFSGKVSVDELVQAIIIHMDMTLLKEALGMEKGSLKPQKHARPLGSYLERISLLFKMGILMSSETKMSALVEILIKEAPTVMNGERATIFLADHEARELYSHMGVGLTHDQIRIPWDTGIAGWVFSHGESLNIVDPYHDPRFFKSVDLRTGFVTKNLLCVPLRSPGGPIIGVFQVLNKRAGVFTPTDLEILEILASQAARFMEHALDRDPLSGPPEANVSESSRPRNILREKDPMDEILGTSRHIEEVRSLIAKVAPSDTTVLIQGESGTGKELVARAIQVLSPRSSRPMISLNCAAIPLELIESELFGHKRGSFTGAVADHEGVFRAAHGGTLFLDEIEAMSPAMQVKLLRAIQVGEIKPVGDNSTQFVDVRLITATNSDLHELVQQGKFREDLFYRINVFPIVIQPLRDRIEDIPLLIRNLLVKYSVQTGKVIRGMDPAALDLFMRYPWPGNVRELENEMERAHIMTSEGANISVRSLSPRIKQALEKIVERKPDRHMQLKEAIDELERKMIQSALDVCNGNRSLAAKRLGLSRQGLINKIHKFGLNEQ